MDIIDSGHSSMNSTPLSSMEEESSFLKWENYVNKLTNDVTAPRPITRCTSNDGFSKSRDAVWQEFEHNGRDSPYDPEDEKWMRLARNLSGMGPSARYLRQKSCNDAERPGNLKPQRHSYCNTLDWQNYMASQQHNGMMKEAASVKVSTAREKVLSDEDQMKILQHIPEDVLVTLFKAFEKVNTFGNKQKECVFCKNNRERETMYRSHVVKDACGKVECPVLRAFKCPRCGATGDNAHTIKYCPYSTEEEKTMSFAVMRSVRMANGRKRNTPSVSLPGNYRVNAQEVPLDANWAMLEQKLIAANVFKK